MNVAIKYSSKPVDNLQDLLSRYPQDEFDSPRRSTVPSLVYWSTPEPRIKDLSIKLDLACPNSCTLDFEYKVPAQKGRGRESHTDLMIYWDEVCIGVEAKYTEPHYPNVKDWLAAGDQQKNRLDVLDGWCSLIEGITKTKRNAELLEDATYQAIHRVASVCSRPEPNKYVVYQVFDPGAENLQYYITELLKIREIFGGSGILNLCLLFADIQPTDKYLSLVNQWKTNRTKCNQDIISGICNGDLFSLSNPNLFNVP
jgi:hypothetical protein